MTVSVPGIVLTGRRVLEQYQLDTVTVLDRTVTRTSGGTTEDWIERTWVDPDPESDTYGETVPRPYPCRFGQVTGFGKVTDVEASLVLGAVIQEKRSQAIQFAVDMVIHEQDRIKQSDGKLWVVVADLTPSSVMKLMVRVVVREI